MTHPKRSLALALPALVTVLACCGGERRGAAEYKFAVRAPVPATAEEALAAPDMAPAGEDYEALVESTFESALDRPLSTFSVDVDTASYANVRRFLNDGMLPPPDAVRIEELVNYFDYAYPQPQGDAPFSVTTEVSDCPWNPDHRLVHIGLQGKDIQADTLPPRNLVFLLDVSGSMNARDKLPLLKQAMAMLVPQLTAEDRVSIVVYAGASGVVLEPTSGSNHQRIMDAFDRLEAGGSTNGGAGIELAYALARRNFFEGGVNRVVLATDGDFNVGPSSRNDLTQLIERERDGGVFLSVLGFGTGNLGDATMELLADKGNGNYAYIDGLTEARKVLVEEASGTLVTIAKDVKIQVEMNPAEVSSYRLIGYENRKLAARDFNDDAKDAGDIGAGHTVTALYEVVPAGSGAPGVDPLRYQKESVPSPTPQARSGELLHVKLRHKAPEGDTSILTTFPVTDANTPLEATSSAFRFSAAVASFGMLTKRSKHAGDATFERVSDMAQGSLGDDPHGHRAEFLTLVSKASMLSGQGPLVTVETPASHLPGHHTVSTHDPSTPGDRLVEGLLALAKIAIPMWVLGALFVMFLGNRRRSPGQ